MKPKMRNHAMYANSVEAIALATLDRAAGPVRLPKFLQVPDAVKPHLEAVLSSRHRHLWTQADLVLAVQCARLLHQLANLKGTVVQQTKDRGAILPRLSSLLRLLRIAGWRPLPRPTVPYVDSDDDLLAH